MTEGFFADRDLRLEFPATYRNREPIAAVLAHWLPQSGHVLEVASGSGEHAVFFQQCFPGLVWHSSDPDPDHRASIAAWIAHEPLAARMPSPLPLDVASRPWSLGASLQADLAAIVAINLIHIAPWACCEALFAEAASRLPKKAPLVLYGPFRRNGCHTSDSNAAFDHSLRSRSPLWGVRDLEAVEALAAHCGFRAGEVCSMPANNIAIAYRR